MSRVRTSEFNYPIGSFKRRKITTNPEVYTPQDNSSQKISRHVCIDTVSKRKPRFRPDHPLSITHRRNQVTPLLGLQDQGAGSYREYGNWYTTIQKGTVEHLDTSIPSVGEMATKLLARTNPNRPHVSAPNFLYELKDLPGMYRDIMAIKLRIPNLGSGRGDPRVIANQHLSNVMGWQPLISDLRKMVTFQDAVDKKVAELERLFSKGGLKRRPKQSLYEETTTASTGSVTIESSLGAFITCRREIITSQRAWGTVRWTSTFDLPNTYSSNKLRRLARQLVFGIGRGISAKQAWDAIPWSWMIDWFSNVGDFLQAHDNTIPVLPSKVNIMTTTKTDVCWTRTDIHLFNWCGGGEGVSTLETLERSLSSGSLTASIPFLDGRKMSILGALALQRLK